MQSTDLEGDVDLLLGHISARQMHACLNANQALTSLDHLRC